VLIPRIHLRARAEERLDEGEAAFPGGHHERRAPIGAPAVDGGRVGAEHGEEPREVLEEDGFMHAGPDHPA
jgi:hypothetical protein